MPTLVELTHMYEGLPAIPPPVPRKRNLPSEKPGAVPTPYSSPKGRDTTCFLTRLLSHFPFRSVPLPSEPTPVKTNPFMALRQGNKAVVIAVVDAGTVSFFRFGQGAFEEWPMV
jgi:tRNA-splicing endonuclease subunit Sen54